jgi:hypothetical protein
MTRENELNLIDELIQSGEGQTIDFKKSEILSNPTKLAKLMVAFANSNGGRILIGICDDGTIEGMKEKKEHERHIMNIGRDKCVPPLVPDFSVINKPEGDIYVVKILRYQKLPHTVKTKEGNVFFIRVGSTVREAEPSEIALLFEAAREKIVSKSPKLELLLLDTDGNATKVIKAQPTIIKKRYVKRKPIPMAYPAGIAALLKQTQALASISSLYGPREPPKDLVPVGIEITNVGEIPAEGIRIFLEFPKECELMSEYDAIGGLGILAHDPTSGGLFVDEDNKSEAIAWIDVLGNDLTMRKFREVYVHFPEKSQEYLIKARITQHSFPPTNYEFKIMIDPQIEEVVEYVDEEET